ncbi:hypothetical protein AMATHDRAFT_88127, partial [Amanita thiersii Skay4041]
MVQQQARAPVRVNLMLKPMKMPKSPTKAHLIPTTSTSLTTLLRAHFSNSDIDSDSGGEEEIGLLTFDRKETNRTPLPKWPIASCLSVYQCEAITASSIYPYINQLIGELDITGGDERKVGYYSGMLDSGYFAAQGLSILYWSRTSDKVGRKPMLLVGLVGNAMTLLLFGFSRTYWMLAFSRCLSGFFNGNLGVTKSTMGDLTDSTNRAEGFALFPIMWAAGASVGPVIGGSFSRPYEQLPRFFNNDFWKSYPYFLPCLVTAGYVSVIIVLTIIYFKETAPIRVQQKGFRNSVSSATFEPVPFRSLLTGPVIVAVSIYSALSFVEVCLSALVPLFMAMSTNIGGMGCSPATIGYVLGSFGAFCGIFQVFCSSRIIRKFGERHVLIATMLTYPLTFALFPIMSMISKNNGSTWLVWAILTFILVVGIVRGVGFSCTFIYITASAPNKASLGATNGLSQTTASVARAIGPAMAPALFSISVERNLLGGYAVYAILFLCSCAVLPVAWQLPQHVW